MESTDYELSLEILNGYVKFTIQAFDYDDAMNIARSLRVMLGHTEYFELSEITQY